MSSVSRVSGSARAIPRKTWHSVSSPVFLKQRTPNPSFVLKTQADRDSHHVAQAKQKRNSTFQHRIRKTLKVWSDPAKLQSHCLKLRQIGGGCFLFCTIKTISYTECANVTKRLLAWPGICCIMAEDLVKDT